MQNQSGVENRWVPDDEYRFICDRVPIVCIDVLPVLRRSRRFVLIERDTFGGRRGLNLVGGGVLYNEPLVEAVRRHVHSTLGAAATIQVESLSIVNVFQYFTESRRGEMYDPRKNAVSVTYTAEVTGQLEANGEAHSLRFCSLDDPPGTDAFGFGQGRAVYEALATLGYGTMPRNAL